jgi:hypothetical protein
MVNKQFKDKNTQKEFDKKFKDIKILQELEELCNENPLKCEKMDKKKLCERTLNLLGYSKTINIDSCKIYKELYNFMSKFELKMYGYNIKKIKVDSFEVGLISSQLKKFISDNEYSFAGKVIRNRPASDATLKLK